MAELYTIPIMRVKPAMEEQLQNGEGPTRRSRAGGNLDLGQARASFRKRVDRVSSIEAGTSKFNCPAKPSVIVQGGVPCDPNPSYRLSPE